MGCASSSPAYEEPVQDEAAMQAASASRDIDKQLAQEKEAQKRIVKMIMLGAGESGKSTVLSQIEIIHGKKYSAQERAAYKDVIYVNVVQSMQVVVEALDMFSIELPANLQETAQALLALGDQPSSLADPSGALSQNVVSPINALWNHPPVKRCVSLSHEFQLNDSAPYFFDSLHRLASADYTPSTDDILRARVKTTGIREIHFHSHHLDWRCFDVGGQRSERKKWIHCFEGVNIVMFVVSISEYNQMLYEDESVPRMQEAASLFDSICNSHWFANSLFTLLLNKTDLFREKLKTFPLGAYMTDFEGPKTYEAGLEYMRNKFTSLIKPERKSQLYHHFTCATDTKAMSIVFAAVNEHVLTRNLAKTGML